MPNPTNIENGLENICVKSFCEKISNLLSLPVPKLIYDSSKTKFAAYSPNEDTIFLNPQVPKSFQLFSLTHELRHKWQLLNESTFYFSDYKG